MTQDYKHPITPPEELVEDWLCEPEYSIRGVISKAAQWGADQELEACCHYFARDLRESLALELRAARRPKPPSLKEQALMALEDGDTGPGASLTSNEVGIIRRALEQLDD
jgi:hypothetical protein